jgi:hypothetical protein
MTTASWTGPPTPRRWPTPSMPRPSDARPERTDYPATIIAVNLLCISSGETSSMCVVTNH